MTLAGVAGLYALFAFTAVIYQEWPHRPGDHSFSACPKDPSSFTKGEWCSGTFDPKGYGLLFGLDLLLIMATPLAAAIWVPASYSLKNKADAHQRAWNIVFALGVALIAITAAFDPIGAVAWYVD